MILRDDELVEYYSLDYVVSELQNDSNKKFKRVHDGIVLEVEGTYLKWKSGYDELSFTDEWLEI